MKKIFMSVVLLLIIPAFCLAMGGSPKNPPKQVKAAYPFLVDNFEDGNFNKDPEWFTFDNIIPTAVRNSSLQGGDSQSASNAGLYSLNLKGSASNWYVGGIGTVLNIDASGYGSFDVDIYGKGENSGLLKIELYDDDNGNSDVEVDKNWKPVYDDLWTYELPINWTGWKHVSIPISQFKVTGGGSKVWDPSLRNGSSGLNKLQLICVATTQTGSVDFNIGGIELGVSK